MTLCWPKGWRAIELGMADPTESTILVLSASSHGQQSDSKFIICEIMPLVGSMNPPLPLNTRSVHILVEKLHSTVGNLRPCRSG